MEQCALRFQDEIYLPYSSWPTSCLPSEASTTQTVLEALAAILDAAGRVMRRKKTAVLSLDPGTPPEGAESFVGIARRMPRYHLYRRSAKSTKCSPGWNSTRCPSPAPPIWLPGWIAPVCAGFWSSCVLSGLQWRDRAGVAPASKLVTWNARLSVQWTGVNETCPRHGWLHTLSSSEGHPAHLIRVM